MSNGGPLNGLTDGVKIYPQTSPAKLSRLTHSPTHPPTHPQTMSTFEVGMRQAAMEFDASDLDRNRQLDFDEFSNMVREREVAVHTEEVLRRRFNDMDLDGSGTIDTVEYIKYALRDALFRSSAQVADLLERWDVDGNGVVSLEEFRRAIMTLGWEVHDDEIDDIFAELDFNHSGALELRELKQKLFTRGSAAGNAESGGAGPADQRYALRPIDWRTGTEGATSPQISPFHDHP